MKLELNAKEWLALWSLLDRHMHDLVGDGGHPVLFGDAIYLDQVHRRMKSELLGSMANGARDQLEAWMKLQNMKLHAIKRAVPVDDEAVAGTVDDVDQSRDYPRSSRRKR